LKVLVGHHAWHMSLENAVSKDFAGDRLGSTGK